MPNPWQPFTTNGPVVNASSMALRLRTPCVVPSGFTEFTQSSPSGAMAPMAPMAQRSIYWHDGHDLLTKMCQDMFQYIETNVIVFIYSE